MKFVDGKKVSGSMGIHSNKPTLPFIYPVRNEMV